MRNQEIGKPRAGTWVRSELHRAPVMSFHCGGVGVDLVNHVAWLPEGPLGLRPQEVRLLGLLSATPARLIPTGEVLATMYSGVPAESARVRLKALMADIRRRLGPRVAARLRAAPGVGLILYVDQSNPAAQDEHARP